MSWAPGAALALAVLLSLPAGCGSPTAPVDVSLDQEFELAVGESALVSSQGIRMSLEAVRSDSRCPSDAVCVWAGDAEVRLSLSRSGRPSATAELHTAPSFPTTTSYEGYTIRLVRLLPHPRTDRSIAEKDYRAGLVVVPRLSAPS